MGKSKESEFQEKSRTLKSEAQDSVIIGKALQNVGTGLGESAQNGPKMGIFGQKPPLCEKWAL